VGVDLDRDQPGVLTVKNQHPMIELRDGLVAMTL
jgi:hypothetical protein